MEANLVEQSHATQRWGEIYMTKPALHRASIQQSERPIWCCFRRSISTHMGLTIRFYFKYTSNPKLIKTSNIEGVS